MTIDFSARIESGVNKVFPDITIQKCVFHAIQLLTRGLIKEFTRVKNERLLAHIKEWNYLRRSSITLEKGEEDAPQLNLEFKDTTYAWNIYRTLRSILLRKSSHDIGYQLGQFHSASKFKRWKGTRVYLQKYEVIFTDRKFKFSDKGLKYVIPKIYKAWRGAIRELRLELETSKSYYNKMKYLILMNPQNMKRYHKIKLTKYLKMFPWLRSYRQIIVKFYYQFRLPLEKHPSFNFLTRLLSENCHAWLRSAINTLIENEESIFQYKHLYKSNPRIKTVKSIKVVNESSNRVLNQLFQTQYGMRTIENIRMRVANRLDCPIFISPSLLEKIK